MPSDSETQTRQFLQKIHIINKNTVRTIFRPLRTIVAINPVASLVIAERTTFTTVRTTTFQILDANVA